MIAGHGIVAYPKLAPMPSDDIVVLKEVRKSFGDTEVLKGIDMVCLRNETTCIVGGSGAGKTTLLRLIVALDRATSGHIYVDGEDIVPMGERELNRVRQKFGMVYQYAALLDSITVLENVEFPLVEHTKLGAAARRERVLDKLRVLGLDEKVLSKYPAELSGGMRKRVGIARAIAGEPKYLLYDEPTSGLDPVNADIIDGLVQRLSQELGVTSVMVTHDVRGAFRVANRLALLTGGKIVMQGTPQEFLASSHPQVKEFLERDFDNPSFAA
jgi:phospholipid/cholesterol/gamma-HCH transport system ATP-binding protein